MDGFCYHVDGYHEALTVYFRSLKAAVRRMIIHAVDACYFKNHICIWKEKGAKDNTGLCYDEQIRDHDAVMADVCYEQRQIQIGTLKKWLKSEACAIMMKDYQNNQRHSTGHSKDSSPGSSKECRGKRWVWFVGP